MSQRKALYQWTQTVAQHLPLLRQSQAKVLAAFSLGRALARRCTLSVVAESLPWLGKPDTVERRLQRFLSNPRLSWEPAAEALATRVLASVPLTGVVVGLVDETSVHEHLKVMVVSLADRGRALPLAWWCDPPTTYPLGQVALITTWLARVARALPADCRVLVQADRGLGTSPDLRRAIHQRGRYDLVRVQGQVRLRLDAGRTVRFATLEPHAGRRWAGWAYAFKKAGWCRCWALGQWRRPHPEPWLLVTNWPGAQGSWYGVRRWEEVAFRDLKSMGCSGNAVTSGSRRMPIGCGG